ncbi:MAG: mechanosensitive ion channel domain-containing protein [Paracoccaceae bacterium]
MQVSRLLTVFVFVVSVLPTLLFAQEATGPVPPSANDLHEFTRLLSDERIQNWIVEQAAVAELDNEDFEVTARQELVGALSKIRTGVTNLGLAWQAAPTAMDLFRQRWAEQIQPNAQVVGLTFIMIFLFLGAGLEWLFRQYTNPIKLRIEMQTIDGLAQRAYAAGLRTLITVAGLVIFAVGSIGAYASFSWPPLAAVIVLNQLVVIFAVRAIWTIVVLFFAPRVPELRLLPVGNATAKYLSRVLLFLSAFIILAVSLVDMYGRVVTIPGSDSPVPQTLAVVAVGASLGAVATLLCVFLSFSKMVRIQGMPMSKSQRMWRLYLLVLILLVFIALLLNVTQVMWSIALIGLLVPALTLIRAWVGTSFDDANEDHKARALKAAAAVAAEAPEVPDEGDAEEEELVEEEVEHLSPYETYRPIALRLARFLAVIAVGIAIALIWNLGIFEPSESPTIAGRIISVLIDSAVALLIADLVWVWAKTAIDRRLDAYVPPQDGQAPGPEARMATLLPLLRIVLMVTLLVMVSLSILTSLGVNIAPILAGAGVLGIAIGFGAQSLVKDVVSGVFFLVDDAFRVGEYVEIDQLRGTVEKISIRSLQIRHHRGAVHTLPFGELKSLTNYSRDWVIMKLEFRVPFETDMKLVKKIVKQIGAKLKANEEYGDAILETLKSQGVRRMEEFNMVIGVKFMTRPGEQWLVRRDAYQMVRDAFDEHGIRMAERNVKVEVAGAENMTEEEKRAIGAAAQDAIQKPLVPGPIPDEP